MLTKRTGKFEDDATFWAAVAECDWATRSKENRGYKAIMQDILAHWDASFIRSFSAVLSQKIGVLTAAIDKWEDANEKSLPCGDDGFSDIRHHIVGLGQEVFEATVRSPRLAYQRAQKGDYVESFLYAIPSECELPKNITMEEARSAARAQLEGWRAGGSSAASVTDDEVEVRAIQRVYGALAETKPEYHAARARCELPWVSSLLDSPYAERVGLENIAVVEGALKQMGAGNMDQDWDFLREAVEGLRRCCNKVYEEELAKLNILYRKGHGLENMLSDAFENGMGGVS